MFITPKHEGPRRKHLKPEHMYVVDATRWHKARSMQRRETPIFVIENSKQEFKPRPKVIAEIMFCFHLDELQTLVSEGAILDTRSTRGHQAP